MSMPNGRPEPPPLRIHHLMIWTAAAAVLISGSMWFERTMRNGPPIENKIVIASLVLLAIAISGALVFTFFGIYWNDRGYPFPGRPGEMLLWILAHTTIGLTAAFLGVFVVFAISDDLLSIYYPVAGLALLIYWFWINGRGMSRHADSMRWRFVFASLVLTSIASILFQTVWLMVVFLLCMLRAAADDEHRKIARGWLHWLGVILAFATTCALIGAFFTWQLFR
jgi:hypothetical protein